MLVSVIIGLFIVLGIILIILGRRKLNDNMEGIGSGISLAFLILGLITLMFIQWPRDVELTKAKYTELKREVSQVSRLGGQECDLTILARKDLFSEVRGMNETIDKNRIYCTSPWVGWFYSEEIGNLPKLNYINEE